MSARQVEASFRPRWWLRGPHPQSVLPSLPLRRSAVRRVARTLLETSRELRLDCGDGAVLQAFHAPPAVVRQSGTVPTLAVLLHGWEGSADSLYILTLARRLHAHGYDVVRLNLRDHGDTHHLNPEPFHSARLDEVLAAALAVQARLPGLPLGLAGFSLGGNFALRLARVAPAAGLALTHVTAVCPVVHGASGLRSLETGLPLYHWYFMRKWRASLRRKRALFPERHRFDAAVLRHDMRALTAELVRRYTDFPDLDAYFEAYAIAGDRLAGLTVPASILMAADDPVIPLDDFAGLQLPPSARLEISPWGGHCGFLLEGGRQGFAERWIADRFAAALQ